MGEDGSRYSSTLQYSYQVNPMDKGARWVTVHGVANSRTQLKLLITHTTQLFQFSSVAQLCPTLCEPMDCSTSGLPVHTNSQSLIKLISIEAVMPSNHLILCHPLLPPSIFPASGSFQISRFFASVNQRIRVSASTSVSNE